MSGGGLGAGGGAAAHPVSGLHVHPLVHEAGEGGEVALGRRVAKIRLRLPAPPPGPQRMHGGLGVHEGEEG